MARLKQLIKAISSDDDSQLRDLLKQAGTADLHDSSGYSLLHWAVQYGATKCFASLCAAGAPVDGLDIDGNSPIMVAAAYGRESMLKELIARGVKNLRRTDGRSALHAAATGGSIFCVRQVLSLIPDSLNEQDDKERTPLHWACQEGHVPVVDELIAAGADVENVSDIDFTPLRISSSEGHVDVVRSLIRAGADVNRRIEREGGSLSGTALHDAAVWQRYDVAKTLIASGADATLPDENGKTALQYAVEAKDSILIELLRKNGDATRF